MHSPDNVPVIIDDVKQNANLVRGIYFTIECDEPQPNWHITFGYQTFPTLLLGLSAIVHAPTVDGLFDSLEVIEEFMEVVEDKKDFHIETSTLWLPLDVFRGGKPERSQVYRLDSRLFSWAWKNGLDGTLEQKQFYNLPRAEYSKEETLAFGKWSDAVLNETRARYRQNRERQLTRKFTDHEPDPESGMMR